MRRMGRDNRSRTMRQAGVRITGQPGQSCDLCGTAILAVFSRCGRDARARVDRMNRSPARRPHSNLRDIKTLRISHVAHIAQMLAEPVGRYSI